MSCVSHLAHKPYGCYRANRAQYTDVSFRSVREEDIQDVALPVMQGEGDAEADGRLSLLCHLVRHRLKHGSIFSARRPLCTDGTRAASGSLQQSAQPRRRPCHTDSPAPLPMANTTQPGSYSGMSNSLSITITTSSETYNYTYAPKSNGISPKSHQNLPNKRPSSCLRFPVWSIASPSNKNRSRSRRNRQEDSIKLQRRPRVSSLKNCLNLILRAIVSLSFQCGRPSCPFK